MRSVRASRGWARAAVAVLAGAMALGVTACGSSSDATGGDGESITVSHVRGETTITGVPEKIVVLGNQWLDTSLALGVTPAAYIDNVAVLGKSAPPWQPKLGESAKPLNTTGNLAEQVAALEPDLILADSFIADQKNYDEFSKVAPTLPGLSKEIITPWQDLVTTLGKVLHKQDEAAKLVAGVNDKIAGITAANPGLRGKTFASTWLASMTQLMVLNDPNDGSAKVFAQLGLGIPKNLVDLPANQGRVALSPERINELTADLLLAGYSTGMDEKWRQLPGYAELPAVRKDSVVFLTTQEITAVNQPTVLSTPYILDKLSPALANAAK
ncbi:ABC transporter substrate-binding protein [Nocardia bhagyanarayanae]|uniref:Iron complex transport system substrate-binding protein n=1 Tax=Nocardia bhagyanarayanae TaxID=1215925 RepID=A0A543F4Q3_9NOCA|nr:ABC transporter substrate-binding protein [Nocardia bhagyanarayanae]TQM28792.1 iron complex transport system substrate-binding protein [Nocardia bhagyanarayanae]